MSSMSDITLRMFSRNDKVLRSKAGKTLLESSLLDTETKLRQFALSSSVKQSFQHHLRYVLELE